MYPRFLQKALIPVGRSLIAFALLVTPLFAATPPDVGTPAPPLKFTQLLQAPTGTQPDWPALRGKVVVLEFWATWCGPCVAAVPHLNQLVASLDPAKFQFISVDDEDPKVVQTFLGKRKMSGWIGIDTTGGIFTKYGAKERPLTVVVDANGRIATKTHPEFLNAADLLAIAAGKPLAMPTLPDIFAEAEGDTKSSQPAAKPPFEFSLNKAATDEQERRMFSSTGDMDAHGARATILLAFAFDIPLDRIVWETPQPDSRYDLRCKFAGKEVSANMPQLQKALTSGLHLRAQTKTETRSVFILKSTDASQKLLVPTASTGGSMYGFSNGKLRMVNRTMNDIAKSLEDALEAPVVNETGIEGTFDAELEFANKQVDNANAALREVMGLELVKAERPISILEISRPADTKGEK